MPQMQSGHWYQNATILQTPSTPPPGSHRRWPWCCSWHVLASPPKPSRSLPAATLPRVDGLFHGRRLSALSLCASQNLGQDLLPGEPTENQRRLAAPRPLSVPSACLPCLRSCHTAHTASRQCLVLRPPRWDMRQPRWCRVAQDKPCAYVSLLITPATYHSGVACPPLSWDPPAVHECAVGGQFFFFMYNRL